VIVLDASAVVELLLGTPRGTAIGARISTSRATVHAPHVVDLEVASAFRALETRRAVSAAAAATALVDLLGLRLTRYAHDPLLSRIWQLRGNLTPYDAVYVALAEHLGATLVTCDRRLAKAPGHLARVELFA
jgi:predicted nucleic acid-binding protein